MPFNDDLDLSPNDDESRAELARIAKGEHSSDCALGAVPACTCGKREAEEFFSKFHNHSQVIHGRSQQTDVYPDGCLVHPDWQLGH